MKNIKWSAVVGGIAAVAAIVFAVPAFLRHNTGAKSDQFPVAFEQLRTCADTFTHGAKSIRGETFAHAVNGGVAIISHDSLQSMVPGQPVIALTHTVIDSVSHDTTITIYTEPPADLAVLKHEYANALAQRHRLVLIGSDTGKFLTSKFYSHCVSYCPRCAAGAY